MHEFRVTHKRQACAHTLTSPNWQLKIEPDGVVSVRALIMMLVCARCMVCAARAAPLDVHIACMIRLPAMMRGAHVARALLSRYSLSDFCWYTITTVISAFGSDVLANGTRTTIMSLLLSIRFDFEPCTSHALKESVVGRVVSRRTF